MIILHFDREEVSTLDEQFVNNVHLREEPMIYIESSMELKSMIQPEIPQNESH